MRVWLHKFDQYFTSAIQAWPDWLHGIMVALSVMGHPVITIAVAMAVVGAGIAKENARLWISGGAAIVALGIGAFLKILLQRDRPLTDYVASMRFDTFSFPSGHTLGSTVSLGLLAFLAWHFLPAPFGAIVAVLLGLVVIGVGLSRIYLGAHFPSDVIAGWLFGLGFLLLILLFVRPHV